MTSPLLIPWFELERWTVHAPLLDRQIAVEPFAVSVLLASFVALVVALLFAKKHRRSIDLTLNLALYLVAFGYPISYLLNGLLYERDEFVYLMRHPAQVFEVQLGWSMYGGVLGALVGAWLWKWRRKASVLDVGDCFAFATPFAWTIARVGCFVTHDHPGTVSQFPLAVADFRAGAPPFQPRHDLGLYDAMVFASIATLFVVLGRKPRKAGFYLGVLPMLYAPCRFLLDFLRAPAPEGGDPRYAGLTPAQYGSILVFIAGIVLMRRVAKSSALRS
jgi:phosphatidylglycerol:prolipoprotein diacylglycerol transferase